LLRTVHHNFLRNKNRHGTVRTHARAHARTRAASGVFLVLRVTQRKQFFNLARRFRFCFAERKPVAVPVGAHKNAALVAYRAGWTSVSSALCLNSNSAKTRTMSMRKKADVHAVCYF
jgi:hypothetical protein